MERILIARHCRIRAGVVPQGTQRVEESDIVIDRKEAFAGWAGRRTQRTINADTDSVTEDVRYKCEGEKSKSKMSRMYRIIER